MKNKARVIYWIIVISVTVTLVTCTITNTIIINGSKRYEAPIIEDTVKNKTPLNIKIL